MHSGATGDKRRGTEVLQGIRRACPNYSTTAFKGVGSVSGLGTYLPIRALDAAQIVRTVPVRLTTGIFAGPEDTLIACILFGGKTHGSESAV